MNILISFSLLKQIFLVGHNFSTILFLNKSYNKAFRAKSIYYFALRHYCNALCVGSAFERPSFKSLFEKKFYFEKLYSKTRAFVKKKI